MCSKYLKNLLLHHAPQGLQMARQLMDEFTKDDQNIMSPLLYERRGGKLAVVHEPI